jgi:hypothetical protein
MNDPIVGMIGAADSGVAQCELQKARPSCGGFCFLHAFPIRPDIRTEHPAISAHHAAPDRWNDHTSRQDVHDPLVLALMASDREHTPFDRMFAKSIGSIGLPLWLLLRV